MSAIDWIFIILSSVGCLLFLLFVVFLFLWVKHKKTIKQLTMRRPKQKKKRKRWKLTIRKLEKKRKRTLWSACILFLLSIGSIAGAFYGLYYQATNLDQNDSSYIATGYYLREQLESELTEGAQSENKNKTSMNISELSARMASYGIRKASPRLTAEAQKLLNRYYKSLQEFGTNLNGQRGYFYDDPAVLDDYLIDLEGIKKNEKKVIDYFDVNEKALKGNN